MKAKLGLLTARFRRYIRTLCAMMLISYPSIGSADIILMPGATDFRISSITDVIIAGSRYNATFHHGVSYASLFSPDPVTFPFPGNPATEAAHTILRNAIAAAAIDASGATDFTMNFYTPYGFFGAPNVSLAPSSNNGLNPLSYFGAGAFSFDSNTPIASNQAYVTYERIPEPATALTVGLGLIGLAAIRRRRVTRAGS